MYFSEISDPYHLVSENLDPLTEIFPFQCITSEISDPAFHIKLH